MGKKIEHIKAIQMSESGNVLDQIEIDDPELIALFQKFSGGKDGTFAMGLSDDGEILFHERLKDHEIPEGVARLFDDASSGRKLRKKYDIAQIKPFRKH